ncbi:hypothetical protein, partial [Thomasclavelia spiroformis]|uniref:hypothetical protein n=1 Tax=Thomasclavelia spiroformis TaxID=29348 RepID=UPI0029434CC8
MSNAKYIPFSFDNLATVKIFHFFFSVSYSTKKFSPFFDKHFISFSSTTLYATIHLSFISGMYLNIFFLATQDTGNTLLYFYKFFLVQKFLLSLMVVHHVSKNIYS